MTDIEKVLGSAGTGKTTEVVGNPEENIDGLFLKNKRKYGLESQMLITYTNAAVDEAVERLYEMLDVHKYVIQDRVSTIHSVCFNLLNLSKENVAGQWDMRSFCSEWDIKYGFDDNGDVDMLGMVNRNSGNALMDIYQWLQSNRYDLSDYDKCPVDFDEPYQTDKLLEKWEEYKEDNDVIGYGDMIDKSIEWGRNHLERMGYEYPSLDDREYFKFLREKELIDKENIRGEGPFVDTKILYVDEVQDLTPLQWEFYLMQSLVADKVYLGGDPNQSIYSWAGADPSFFLNERGDRRILDKTYRIPSNVWEVCHEIIKHADVRSETDIIEPAYNGGKFVFVSNPPIEFVINEAISSGDTFVLLRANYMVETFAEHLNEYGIPHTNMSSGDTWKGIEDLRDALSKIDSGADTLTGSEMRGLMQNATDDMIQYEIDTGDYEDVYDIDDARMYFDIDRFTMDGYLEEVGSKGYDGLSDTRIEAIRENIRRDFEFIDKENIKIGTIHSSKGKEADTVILGTDTTRTIMNEIKIDTQGTDKEVSDEERRVYFVGASRSERKLILVEDMLDGGNHIDADSLLPGYDLERVS